MAEPPERLADALLLRLHAAGSAEIFVDVGDLEGDKTAADLLVAAKMARFADEGRTELAITNPGRYWATHGGYLAFLREEPAGSGGGRGRNPELEAMRLTYTRLRLTTFWWSFGMSLAGFLLSLLTLVVTLRAGLIRF